jgi:hypothetical protein
VTQLQNDPQTGFANIPSWVFTTLTTLADANGFGIDDSANIQPDPAMAAFDAQLAANVPGPYATVSDTGFLAPPTNAAGCAYIESLLPGAPCQVQTVPTTGDYYEFTYQIGPYAYDGDTYTSLVNFQIYYRDVTEQQVVPEPAALGLLGAGVAALGLIRRNRTRPTTG